ncbi:hypothetical protein G9F71_022440 [Clostridium sp. FP2]|uniref:hypothetical protein n=1 Tax=Clostridium sp. FP2 TaxID=2724481 RepID=UPI0013E92149|nr:hypothetical protein [Clostridium sp. FP2]MBZ9625591.1 hypothetical protein [Clostridium sp. FP2]
MKLVGIQTTPQLFGWFSYNYVLLDFEKSEIIREYISMWRPLEKYFVDTYMCVLSLGWQQLEIKKYLFLK